MSILDIFLKSEFITMFITLFKWDDISYIASHVNYTDNFKYSYINYYYAIIQFLYLFVTVGLFYFRDMFFTNKVLFDMTVVVNKNIAFIYTASILGSWMYFFIHYFKF